MNVIESYDVNGFGSTFPEIDVLFRANYVEKEKIENIYSMLCQL